MSRRDYLSDDSPNRYEILTSAGSNWQKDEPHDTEHPYTMTLTKWHQSRAWSAPGIVPVIDYGVGSLGFPGLLRPSQAEYNNMYLHQVSKLVDKLRDSELNLGSTLGEGRETLTMIGTTIYRLASAVRHLRRLDVQRAAKVLGVDLRGKRNVTVTKAAEKDFRRGVLKNTSSGVSNAWLELQMGWKPLLSDIHSGAEAVANILNKPRTVSARASNKFPGSNQGMTGSRHLTLGITEEESWYDLQFTLRVTIAEQVDNLTRLGLNEPFSVLWEVTPFSFLADYVVPIGTYLHAKEALNKMDVVGYYWVSEKLTQRATKYWSAFNGHIVGQPMVYMTTTFTRKSFPGSTLKNLPLPRVKPLKEIFSVAHTLNAIALLGQAMR